MEAPLAVAQTGGCSVTGGLGSEGAGEGALASHRVGWGARVLGRERWGVTGRAGVRPCSSSVVSQLPATPGCICKVASGPSLC